jgi:hypothetical protein
MLNPHAAHPVQHQRKDHGRGVDGPEKVVLMLLLLLLLLLPPPPLT